MNRLLLSLLLAPTLLCAEIRVGYEQRPASREPSTNNVPLPEEYENGIATTIAYYRSIDGSNGWAVARTSLGTEIKTPWYGSPTNSITAILQSLAAEDAKHKQDKETSDSVKKDKASFDQLNNKEQIEYLRKRIEVLEKLVQ